MKFKKNVLKDWKFWAVAVVLYIIFAGVGQYHGSKLAQEETQSKPRQVTAEQRQGMVDSCVSSGSNTAFCGCIVDKMNARYSLEELAEFNSRFKKGEVDAGMLKAINECREQVSGQ